MVDIRETQNYEFVLGEGPPDVRLTQTSVFILGNIPTPDARETLSYVAPLGQATAQHPARLTQASFFILGNIVAGTKDTCGFLSFMRGNFVNGLASPINPGPVARQSSFGPTGEIL